MATEGTKWRSCLEFRWRIEKLCYWEPDIYGMELNSPTFRTRTVDGKLLFLSLCRMGENGGDLRVSLAMSRRKCDLQSGSSASLELGNEIDCELSFFGDDGSPLFAGTVRKKIILKYTVLDVRAHLRHVEVFVTRWPELLPHETLTVLCRIWNCRRDLEADEYISARTRIAVREESFLWNIKGFRNLQLNEQVIYPVHLVPVAAVSCFTLSFSLTGESLEDAEAKLEVTADEFTSIVLILELSVLDKHQKVVKCLNPKIVLHNSAETIILSKLFSRKWLLKRGCLLHDVLTLNCELSFSRGKDVFSIIERTYCGPANMKRRITGNNVSEASCQTSQDSDDHSGTPQQISDSPSVLEPGAIDPQNPIQSLSVLQEDFLSLYRDHSLSDFELRTGDVSFPVHKTVLSARSPVFKDIFSRNTNESDSNFLDVTDVDAHTLNRMLTFLYAVTVDSLQWEEAAKLYHAADKYQITSLKQQCLLLLRSSITVSNVSDILTLADSHQDQELTCFAHNFVLRHFDEIMLSDEWKTFMKSDAYLAGNTMHQLYAMKIQVGNCQ